MAIVLGQTLDTLYRVGATTPALVNGLDSRSAPSSRPPQQAGPAVQAGATTTDSTSARTSGSPTARSTGRRASSSAAESARTTIWLPAYGWNDRMRLNAPFAGFYQNYALTDAAQSPDGLGELWTGQRSHDHRRKEQRERGQLQQPAGHHRRRRIPSGPRTSIRHQPSSRVCRTGT